MQSVRLSFVTKCSSLSVAVRAPLHTTSQCFKFQTDTELVHQGVKFGLSSYPSRPNDPRVPSNPNFGITHLHRLSDEPTALGSPEETKKAARKDSISKAMKIYLERAKKHSEFILEQEQEFDMGRRHLANMMGVNEATMSQTDINIAIQYLMPSGIFDRRARPRMLPPSEIYPSIKKAQFQADGRPFHSLFYTGKANFYQACFEIEEEMTRLKEHENAQVRRGITKPPAEAKIEFSSSTWLSQMEMKQIFLEKVDTKRFEAFVIALQRLADHPYSKMSAPLLNKYRKQLKTAAEMVEIAPLKHDDAGRPYMDAVGIRKHCVAYVTVRGEGTGKVNINGRDTILYFNNIQEREQIMTPLKFTGLLGKVDIECRTMHEEYTKHWSEDVLPFPTQVRRLGAASQAGAIRYGLSLALKSFVDRDTVEKMRLVGLLTQDTRQKERKKWGQEGARRKYTWKKR